MNAHPPRPPGRAPGPFPGATRPLLLALSAVCLLVAGGATGESGASVLPVPAEADLLLVQPHAGTDLPALRTALAGRGVETLPPGAYDVALRAPVPGDEAPAALAQRLARSGLARSVEPDQVVRGTQAGHLEPADPLYRQHQWSYLRDIRAPEAWADVEARREADGPPYESAVIAIVDSGVDWNHPDLAEQTWVNTAEQFGTGRDESGSGCVDDVAGCNFVSPVTADPGCNYQLEAPNWRAMDDEGHGTFVAGLAAGRDGTESGMAGIAWHAQIMSVKVLDCTSTGRISEAAAGIRYAAQRGADVINVSFGTRSDSFVLREAVEEAQALGALIVASAGNDGAAGITYPAAYPGVIAVAASGLVADGAIDYRVTAEFATFGSGIDVIAPGVNVLSTVPAFACEGEHWECHEAGPYAINHGSSFATPIVSGAAALARARHPDRHVDFIGHLVVTTRQPGGAGASGAGLLDLAAALARESTGTGVPGTSTTGPGDAPPGGAPPGPGGHDPRSPWSRHP